MAVKVNQPPKRSLPNSLRNSVDIEQSATFPTGNLLKKEWISGRLEPLFFMFFLVLFWKSAGALWIHGCWCYREASLSTANSICHDCKRGAFFHHPGWARRSSSSSLRWKTTMTFTLWRRVECTCWIRGGCTLCMTRPGTTSGETGYVSMVSPFRFIFS